MSYQLNNYTVSSNALLDDTVCDTLTIRSGVKVRAEKLEKVSQIIIYAGGKLTAPNLKIADTIIIYAGSVLICDELLKVDIIKLLGPMEVRLKSLKEIGTSYIINTKLRLMNLVSLDSMTISGSDLTMPLIEHISGYLSVLSNSILIAGKLKTVGEITTHISCFIASSLECVFKQLSILGGTFTAPNLLACAVLIEQSKNLSLPKLKVLGRFYSFEKSECQLPSLQYCGDRRPSDAKGGMEIVESYGDISNLKYILIMDTIFEVIAVKDSILLIKADEKIHYHKLKYNDENRIFGEIMVCV